MMIPIAGSVISDPPPHPGNTYAEGQHPKRSTSAKGAHSFVVVCMFPLPVVVMSNEPRHFLMMQVLQWLPAAEICKTRAVSQGFTDPKELAFQIRSIAKLHRSGGALIPPNVDGYDHPARIRSRGGLNCMLRMHEIWRRHAPEETWTRPCTTRPRACPRRPAGRH